MSTMKYITDNPAASNCLSRTANAIMLLLYFNVDEDNLINKEKFMRRVGLVMDTRTWNKYWLELESKGILARTGIKTWMLSPYQCYSEGKTHKTLAATWNKLTSNKQE